MCENNGLIERLQKHLENDENDLQTWTDSLEELSEIEDAFEPDEKNRLRGKTILDIGTDCVKPLYIALKFEPDKIVGINEDLSYSYTSDIEQKSKLFAETEIRFYDCSFFDNETFNRILRKEKRKEEIKKFDFVLVSKTLHHLRTKKCVKKHKCREDEKCCKYGFDAEEIFEKLLNLGKRVIVYETFFPQEEDLDKVRGRGEYFTTKEWTDMFKALSGKYDVKFIRPEGFLLDKEKPNKVDSTVRKVDTICFYVEKQDVKNSKKLIAKAK